MPGGGSIQGMITSLKNNKRSRVSVFKKLKGYQNVTYKEGKVKKKATPQQLKEIREELQKRNRQNIIFSVIFVTVTLVILYILFNFAPLF